MSVDTKELVYFIVGQIHPAIISTYNMRKHLMYNMSTHTHTHTHTYIHTLAYTLTFTYYRPYAFTVLFEEYRNIALNTILKVGILLL